ncbi:type 2 DNA topoisomerase 6 subunit B-like isoform X2 [Magnolia sinica]|uniref:type 2 DNA topoisomerase 6 subunit B-like isoform X2 n=1 Tax=Magnolia sinica TaxID=86752 RepID=UPI002658AA38|nr:type 2 DNA topoisomerase 6 subunit B-like isoform X2 [Magnolia sinica]
MEISSTRKLCRSLIACAIRRCRISENPCRLSVLLKISPDSDPPLARIAISDTGVGSSLAEFQDVEHGRKQISVENWDGVLFITTTSICDKEVYHYRLNLKETVAKKKLARLPSTPKKDGKFSGTEVSFSTHESIPDFVAWITRLCREIVIIKVPKVVVELVVEHMNNSGSRCEQLLQANEGIILPSSMPNIERLTSGLEDFVLRHGNALDKECQGCFLSREHLKVGSGVADGGDSVKSTGQIMEVVIVITEVPKSLNPPCLTACGKSTEVLFFQDFSPCSIPQSSLTALASIDWQNYGLALRTHFVDGDGHAVLQWEELPPFAHIDIALHSYHIKPPQTQQRNHEYKNLVKKAVKLALDDLKAKYPGILLSPNALKIRRYAPDLSRAIAGLISSSNDLEFRAECVSLLGLDPLGTIEQGKIESCITEKIGEIIAMNDCKPNRGRGHGPLLFREDGVHTEDYQDEGDEECEDINILDL